MGDFIAIAIVILAVVVIVFRVLRIGKGKDSPKGCGGCTSCDLGKYGIVVDPKDCKEEKTEL